MQKRSGVKNVYREGTILYLAGPITADSKAQESFRVAEKKLSELGYVVINPFDVDPSELFPDYHRMKGKRRDQAQLKADIAAMMKCDGVATLPLVAPSEGMARELHLAHSLDMKVMPIGWWVPRAPFLPRI